MTEVYWLILGSSTDFFYVCISTKWSLPAESRSQVLPNLKFHKVIRFTGRETAFKPSSLTRPGVHWKGMTAMAQLPQICYAGGSLCMPKNIRRTMGPCSLFDSNDSSFSWKFDSSDNTLEVQNQIAPNRYSPETWQHTFFIKSRL